MKHYEIRDPVYGFISFNDLEKAIISHPAFQRLRRIRQLALTEMVYPGATHTRFEHSLGVMYMATLMYDTIINNDENKTILKERSGYHNDVDFEKDRQLIRLAALLHDVGHAPFSHPSEEMMPKNSQTDKSYKHEDYTVAIIKECLRETIENHPVNKTNGILAEDVAALIEGNAKILGKRSLWRVLISSQLDADRGDYLLRDSYHIGVKYGVYDHARLINTLALGIDPESDEVILGVDEGGWHTAESLVIARYQMFAQVYFHKTRRAFDYHLKEAMKDVLPTGKLPSPKEIEKFLDFDDFSLWALFKNNKEKFSCRSILYRDPIRQAYSTPETPTNEDEDKLKNKEDLLKKKHIWSYTDMIEKSWYKNNEEKIMIINKKTKRTYPLSENSFIVKNMMKITQKRIYVKPANREKVDALLK